MKYFTSINFEPNNSISFSEQFDFLNKITPTRRTTQGNYLCNANMKNMKRREKKEGHSFHIVDKSSYLYRQKKFPTIRSAISFFINKNTFPSLAVPIPNRIKSSLDLEPSEVAWQFLREPISRIFFSRRARIYDTDHQCCPRDRQQDIFCSFELRRVPFVPRSSRWSTIGIGKRKRPPKTRLLAIEINLSRFTRQISSLKGGGQKKKARKDSSRVTNKNCSTFIQCARRDARPPTVSCVATERRRDARTRPRTTENVETTPGVSTTINTISNA